MLLLSMIVVFIGVMIAIGIQIFYIFGEIRKSTEKMNSMLDKANEMTSSLANTVASFTSVTDSLKTGLSFVSLFKGFFTKKKKGEKQDEEQ